MAALTSTQVAKIRGRLLAQHVLKEGRPARNTKTQYDAAVTTTNTWIDANLASYLTALAAGAPEVAADFNAQEKALLFALVVMEKYGLL